MNRIEIRALRAWKALYEDSMILVNAQGHPPDVAWKRMALTLEATGVALGRAEARAAEENSGDDSATESDLLDLLHKLASGEGGRRTGELARRGWLRWEVTEEGRRVLRGEGS